MSEKKLSVAIVGASGLVGREILAVLKKRNFPLSRIDLFTSPRSAGKELDTPIGTKSAQEFKLDNVKNFDVVFLAAGGGFAKKYARALASQNKLVIDNSSAFRQSKDVPLVVPEINPKAIAGSALIANPNCTTAILAVVLWPLHKEFGINKLIVSTYQAVSGAGQAAMAETEQQAKDYATGKELQFSAFARPILFNLIPRIDDMEPNGYSREEMKVVRETRKIFGDNKLDISCTAVRLPTMRAHAEAVTLVTQKEVDTRLVKQILVKAPGVRLTDQPEDFALPMPLTATGQEDVEVGRIRNNLAFGKKSLDLFICGDQLLKGAALNVVQIAEVSIGRE